MASLVELRAELAQVRKELGAVPPDLRALYSAVGERLSHLVALSAMEGREKRLLQVIGERTGSPPQSAA